MKHCTICGIWLGEWHSYGLHTCSIEKSTVKPENTSGRTKLQIVIEAEETYLKPYLIGAEWAGRI